MSEFIAALGAASMRLELKNSPGVVFDEARIEAEHLLNELARLVKRRQLSFEPSAKGTSPIA
jgi:hypothetical protein